LLAPETDIVVVRELAGEVAQLATTADDRRQARQVLLGLLAHETDILEAEQLESIFKSEELAHGLARLDPTVHDLRTWRAWTRPPTAELLTAVRRNSPLTNWLAALPSLSSLSRGPA
jgi:hypothetical protein